MVVAVLASELVFSLPDLSQPSTHVVFVAASLEQMTPCEENRQDYYCEQRDCWDNGHRKSLSPRLAPNNRMFS